MTDGVEFSIPAALIAAYDAWNTGTPIDTQHPGRFFKPPTPGAVKRWIRLVYLPSDTASFGTPDNCSNQHVGLMQIDIMYQKETETGKGGGHAEPARLCSQLIALFHKGAKFDKNGFRVKIPRHPTRLPTDDDGDPNWSMTSIRVPYVCFATGS